EVQIRYLPQVQRVGAEVEEVFRRARGRRRKAIEIGRQNAAKGVGQLEADLRRRLSGEHGGAVERAELGARKGRTVIEDVVSNVIGAWHHGELGIVVELHVAVIERVKIVGAGGVRSLRDGDALPEPLC